MEVHGERGAKRVIVSGASRGIGRAVALRLARDGMRTFAVGRDERALAQVARDAAEQGNEIVPVVADLSNRGAADRIVKTALGADGPLDALVHSAGATVRGDLLTVTENDWRSSFAVKFEGAVRLARAAWPHLKAGRGCIVNVVGTAARTPTRDFMIGSSVNAALLAFTKALADRGIDDGVRAVAINPGPVQTERLARRLEAQAARERVSTEEAGRRMVASARITRLGVPEDIAGLVSFVLSSDGDWLQGAIIDMDGGLVKTL